MIWIMIKKLAKLANLKVSKNQEKKLSKEFNSVLKLVSKIQKLKLGKVIGTSHVLKSTNVLREDKINVSRILTQKQTLSGAKMTHNGYFVVDSILNQDE